MHMRNERGSKKSFRTKTTGKSTTANKKSTGTRKVDREKPKTKTGGSWTKGNTPRKSSGNDTQKHYDKSEGSSFKKFDRDKKPGGVKKYGKSTGSDKPHDKFNKDGKSNFKKKFTSRFDDKKTFQSENSNGKSEKTTFQKKSGSYKDFKKKGKREDFEERKEYKRKTGIKTYTDKSDESKTYAKGSEIIRNKDGSKGYKKTKVMIKKGNEDDGLIRLNKYIANAGICSRREADTFIQTGVVTVNGVTITELGYKVKPEDVVKFGDKPIVGEKLVYILLNKPKDYITTSKDPQNRRTVYDLVSGIRERVFPIGRLDRNTTGVLLLTNDGHLAEKLMHPRKNISKIYHVEVNKKFSVTDLEALRKGLELEDGFFKPDVVDYVEGMDKHHVGIEIHSGKNRIVRRLFESLDYDVVKLDRVVYAGLTKKGLTRGKWRFLKDAEVYMLKMM